MFLPSAREGTAGIPGRAFWSVDPAPSSCTRCGLNRNRRGDFAGQIEVLRCLVWIVTAVAAVAAIRRTNASQPCIELILDTLLV